MTLRTVAVDAVAKQVAQTPHVQRYKGSYLIVAAGVSAGLGGILPYLADAPWWVSLIITTLVTFATFLTNRLTKDGFTPSMVERVAQEIPDEDVVQYEGRHRAPSRFSLYD